MPHLPPEYIECGSYCVPCFWGRFIFQKSEIEANHLNIKRLALYFV